MSEKEKGNFKDSDTDDENNRSEFDKKCATPKELDLDDILVNELGQFGRFQLKNIFLVAIPIILCACKSEYIFTAATIPHRCQIPECGENAKNELFNPEWLENVIPTTTGGGWASCERFVPILGAGNGTLDYCSESLFDKTKTQPCDGFVYAADNTAVYDFNLGCQEWRRALAGTLSMVGTLLVLPITGYVSDKFGRRIALVASLFNLGLFGVIKAFSVNYPMFLATQLLETTLGGGAFSSAFVFATELVGPKFRVVTGASCSAVFALGQVCLGLLAWTVQPWRNFLLSIHIPCFLILTYYWLLTESVRWLLSKRRYDEARRILEKVARANRREISEESLYALMNPPPALVVKSEEPSLVKVIFNSRILLQRVCTTPVWWISTTFVYYGLSINSVGLSDQKYFNYILVSAVEIPGFFSTTLFLDRFGRKTTLSCAFLLSAACNIAFIFVSKDEAAIRLTLFLIGKFVISLVFSSLYIYTSELYPTEYRHTLLAFSSMVGRIGSVVAPLTPALKIYWDDLPSAMFGVMGLLAGLLALTQPETLGKKMPDTLAEAEAIERS